MRNLLILLLGLVLGAIFSAMATNALAKRSALPRGVMAVMQHELSDLRADVRSSPCLSDASQSTLPRLRVLADEIEPAFFSSAPGDADFRRYAGKLREAIDRTRAAGSDCPALASGVASISEQCDLCHREFR